MPVRRRAAILNINMYFNDQVSALSESMAASCHLHLCGEMGGVNVGEGSWYHRVRKP